MGHFTARRDARFTCASAPRAGKSATLFEACRRLGRKTLYVLSEEENMHQTRDNLLGSATVYGWMPGARVGWLQGSWDKGSKARPGTKAAALCDWRDKDFVIASARSLLECGYPREVLAEFGTLVVDEADVVAADTVRHLTEVAPCRHTIGASATPDRRDGLQRVVHWLLGPSVFVYKRLDWVTGRTGTVRVLQVARDDASWPFEPVRYRNGDLGWTETLQRLAGCPRRNAFLVDVVADCVAAGRWLTVVFTAFVDHAEELFEAVRCRVGSGGAGEACRSVVILHGKMPPKEQDAARAAAKDPATRVLVTTYHKLQKGFDEPRITDVVLALPRGDTRQAVGRCERTAPGKPVPQVLDVVENWGAFAGLARKRAKFYASRGFDVLRCHAAEVRALLARRAKEGVAGRETLAEEAWGWEG